MDTASAIPVDLPLPEVTGEALLVGASVLILGLLVALVTRVAVRAYVLWRGRSRSAAVVFSRVSGWVVGLLAVGLAVTVVFPSVQPVDLLGGIGVISIAAGIAFQTVLGNMFAGLVLLSREVINVGDQVAVADVRGTVTQMALTTTTVRTFDGRQVLIPNGTMHSSVVVVQTGYETVRSSVEIDLDQRVDVGQATAVALAAIGSLPEVASTPEPEALLRSVGTGTVAMELRFWSGARQLETVEAQDSVIRAGVAALHEHDVAMSAQTDVVEAAPSLERALDAIQVVPVQPKAGRSDEV